MSLYSTGGKAKVWLPDPSLPGNPLVCACQDLSGLEFISWTSVLERLETGPTAVERRAIEQGVA